MNTMQNTLPLHINHVSLTGGRTSCAGRVVETVNLHVWASGWRDLYNLLNQRASRGEKCDTEFELSRSIACEDLPCEPCLSAKTLENLQYIGTSSVCSEKEKRCKYSLVFASVTTGELYRIKIRYDKTGGTLVCHGGLSLIA